MLWISTQDEKSLINAKEIKIDKKKIEGVMGTSSMDYWKQVLGKYETEERAIEVLHEIFEKLEASEEKRVTFKMPKF